MILHILDLVAAAVSLSLAIVLVYVGTPKLVNGQRFLDVLIGAMLVSFGAVIALMLFGGIK